MSTTFWHYTCDHAVEAIGAEGTLRPAQELTTSLPVWWWPGAYVWLTDLASPIRLALGLTMHMQPCDRTEHRYRVTDAQTVMPWVECRKLYRHDSTASVILRELESPPEVRIKHWFVSAQPVPVVLDDIEAEWHGQPAKG